MKNFKTLSIVIPCYNEEKNISPLLEKIARESVDDGFELVLVDNGSTDQTQKIIQNVLSKYSFLKLVIVEENQGYGYGILKGLEEANGEFLGWTHADLQTHPKDIFKGSKEIFAEKYAENVFLKGHRQGRPLKDNIFTWGMAILLSCIFRCRLWEINAQPTIFHRSFFESWENPPWDFSLDLFSYIAAKKRGLNIKRIDVFFPERVHGESSWNSGFMAKLRLIKRTLQYSLMLKKTLKI